MTKEGNITFREEIIKEQFSNALGYELNLENPRTFNEKLQWLKLYYHDPLMTKCADKYLVREFIKETIGEEYLIPLIGVWDRVEDIDFDSLPNQFVLKVNWGSGQNIIVKDKTKLDIEEVKNKLSLWLLPTSNHYYYSYEWCYKNIEPKIICEEYIEQMDGNLFDYKFHCFNGVPRHIGVFLYRNTPNFRSCYYNVNWQKEDYQFGYKKYDDEIMKPNKLYDMINISKILSNYFINVRVDFFEVENKLYVGELTLYDGAGLDKFFNIEQDYKFGELLTLPKEKRIEYDYITREELIEQVVNLEPIIKQYRNLENNYNSINVNNDTSLKNKIDENNLIELEKLQNIYNEQFWSSAGNYNYRSAKVILPILFKYYKPDSVIDIGCGIGTWLKAMLEFNISNIHGVDCNKVSEKYLLVSRKYIEIDNLETHVNYSNKKYDLAISVEVAEHLDNSSSENFIKMLTSYSNVIIFSAGIPHQSGDNHINCQPPEFWYRIFSSLGYVCFDFRHELMNMWESVTPPYAQNLLLYVHKDMAYIFQNFELTNRPLFYYHPHYVNDIIIEYDNKIKDNTNNIMSKIDDIKLSNNWFNLLTILNIPFLCISNNSSYFRITIFGIKLTFRVNEESINKMAWWIPIKKWREAFSSKFAIADQTRPDQTRPDQTRPDQT